MASNQMSDGAMALAAWHNLGMTQIPPKRSRDPSQLAKAIIDLPTGKQRDCAPTPEEQGKDPAAVALRRRAGRARAASMRAKRRSEIARKEANAPLRSV
jgi:hypothetical protein